MKSRAEAVTEQCKAALGAVISAELQAAWIHAETMQTAFRQLLSEHNQLQLEMQSACGWAFDLGRSA